MADLETYGRGPSLQRRTGDGHATIQERSRLTCIHPELLIMHEVTLGVPKSKQFYQCIDFRLLVSRVERVNFCSLNSPVCGIHFLPKNAFYLLCACVFSG